MKCVNLLKIALISLIVLAPLLFISTYVMSTVSVQAQSTLDPICDEYPDDDTAPEICRESGETRDDDASDSSALDFLLEVVDVLLLGITIVAVIMLIVGGLKYMTSTGEPAKTTSARNTIIYALVGIVVAVFARVIVLFVLDRL